MTAAPSLAFPGDFLWGSATAAHQVEGDNRNSDCWALEQAQPSIFREPSGSAVDQWNRFADDMALLASLGLKSYRFSIEWARLEPEAGNFSAAALAHYQRCIDACLERGIVPMITYHHFTAPVWVARAGGMNAPGFADLFARYCEHVTRKLQGFHLACTINELNVPMVVEDIVARIVSSAEAAPLREAAHRALGAPLQSMFLFTPAETLTSHGLEAHRKGRDAIKSVRPEIQVGLTLAIQDEQAEPGGEPLRDARVARMIAPFLDGAAGDDFIGVQNYTRVLSRSDGTSGPETGHPLTIMGYEDRPQALAQVCRYAWERARTPIYVTENGWAGDDDQRRTAFVRESLTELHAAIEEGVDVRGYYYWSMLDNFEWMAGYKPKFGLIEVERATQRRLIKPSALAYGLIARANAVTAAAQPKPVAAPAEHFSGAAFGV